jgi:hypothetical protein
MMVELPRRLRLGFPGGSADSTRTVDADAQLVAFVAYGEDCILSGEAVLDADRLTDMLNDHEEYELAAVTVDRLDTGSAFDVANLVVPRDEIFMVHATGPRGDVARRHRTTPQHLAIQMGPYQVRGFFHALPGADPVDALRRRKAMVPLTEARIGFVFGGQRHETRVETLIINREQIDWVEQVAPTDQAFPVGPNHRVPNPV